MTAVVPPDLGVLLERLQQQAERVTRVTEIPLGMPERPVVYPRDAVLTIAEVGAWLGKSARTIRRKAIKRTPEGLILAQWVYEYLEKHAE